MYFNDFFFVQYRHSSFFQIRQFSAFEVFIKQIKKNFLGRYGQIKRGDVHGL